MTRAEWITRFASRIRALTGSPIALAEAEAVADEQIELYGASMLAWQCPEDAAEELAAFGDDEAEEQG